MLLGEKIDALAQLRDDKKELEKLAKAIDAKAKELELDIMNHFEAEGTDGGRSAHFSASVSSAEVPSVTDWDAFHAFIVENKWLHLLERRPSVSGCRELFQQNKVIPGVEVFTKKTLRLNARSTT